MSENIISEWLHGLTPSFQVKYIDTPILWTRRRKCLWSNIDIDIDTYRSDATFASRHLKSPVTRPFVQQLFWASSKEKIKA